LAQGTASEDSTGWLEDEITKTDKVDIQSQKPSLEESRQRPEIVEKQVVSRARVLPRATSINCDFSGHRASNSPGKPPVPSSPKMKIAQLWRFPVKSMAGEPLQQATLTPLGIRGDRVVHLESANGHYVTSRTHPQLLGYHGTLDTSGEPRVDGLPWSDAKVQRIAEQVAGPGAKLVRDESGRRFDVLPLLIATDGAITAFGHDSRRLRPNIVISGVDGLTERTWPGRCLRIGDVYIGVQDLRGRCVMTTFDPDTLSQDHRILKEIVQKFGGELALNCYVLRSGKISLGDSVELLKGEECAELHALHR
jgi:hypothetical protein